MRHVAASAEGISLSELSRATGIPKATCLRIVGELTDESVLTVDPATKRYGIGLGALAISSPARPKSAYSEILRVLAGLADQTGENAGVDVLGPDGVVVVAEVDGAQLIGQRLAQVPRVIPTWCTSTGKVLLAGLPAGEIETDYPDARRRYLETPTHRYATLDDELSDVRRDGFASAIDELAPGAAAFACPIVVAARVAAAVWIGGPSFRLNTDTVGSYLDALREAASSIGKVLSLTGGNLNAPTDATSAQ